MILNQGVLHVICNLIQGNNDSKSLYYSIGKLYNNHLTLHCIEFAFENFFLGRNSDCMHFRKLFCHRSTKRNIFFTSRSDHKCTFCVKLRGGLSKVNTEQ